ncbi:uncharacterized protein VICG_01460 [Vittaforma corneae ATCC 50505]|uniref:Endonuclease/exonuclease/phosphatase domain-containing protein n=1 Tax=Vittaforma corneae (strain ATCC 50505) TaxID=993615 RepID=L2GKU3_VITCO|nr:uncharacterized protein VICG_01460 [Vittaforma corneae ATCC 50505]ELA41476.1 hypothetical protein VICG_01460 [Vittaforma corneae ATCC 50505]
MKIVSINVNGLRAFDEKNHGNFNKFCLDLLQADIVCLQEIKGSDGSLSKYHALEDYQTFSSFYKKGRHGVSTLVRKNLFCGKCEEIMPGRILKTCHGSFSIYNCYMPYYDESKEEIRQKYIEAYDKLRLNLPETSVILCGDFNATYNMLDHYQFVAELNTLISVNRWQPHSELLARFEKISFRKFGENIDKSLDITPKMKEKWKLWKSIVETADEFMDQSMKKDRVEKINPSKVELPYHFFSLKELEDYFYEVYQRAWMKKLVDCYVDTFRLFNDGLSKYTCWNTIFNLRPANLGTRIDYILCSKDIRCTKSGILPEIKGSDHCPVFAEFEVEPYEEDGVNLAKRKNNLLAFFKPKTS